jgi:hypothetical protein
MTLFGSGIQMVGFYSCNGPFDLRSGFQVAILKPDYSDHSNTGHSNYGTIEFPDTFASGFGMVFNHPIYGLFLKWFASLDRLIRNENILVTLFIYRTV